MTSLIFIDTNVPIYAAGTPHPIKQPCIDILSLVAQRPSRFFTDVEVFQELLHRYLSIGAWTLRGRPVFDDFAALMHDRIEPTIAADIEHAATLADRYTGLSSRDLLHTAVMNRVGTLTMISADHGFDIVPGMVRLDPASFATWREQIAD